MRRFLAAALVALVLCACQTASHKAIQELAGTNWRATDASTDPRYHFTILEFGSKVSPTGLDQVRIRPNTIVFCQVIDDKLVMRADFFSDNRSFDFDLDGDKLTLTALDAKGNPSGVQHFARVAPSHG